MSAWLLDLGDGWYEGECCHCGEAMLIRPGDTVHVVVGQKQNIDAVVCTACQYVKGSVDG